MHRVINSLWSHLEYISNICELFLISQINNIAIFFIIEKILYK